MGEDVGRRAESYFSSLNSMARRVIVDVRHRRSEKGEGGAAVVEDSAFFAPHKICEKYAFYPQSEPDVDCFPKMSVRSGGKYVVDEDSHGKGSGCTWRDEHSSPFIWQTQSQLDLSYVGTEHASSKNSKTDSPERISLAPSKIKQCNDVRKENANNGAVISNSNVKNININNNSTVSASSPSPRVFLTKKMEKQLSGKCKAPPSAALLPPLPDKPPPQVISKSSSANGSMKCPPPKPPSSKKAPSMFEPQPPPPSSSSVGGRKKSAEIKNHPVIRGDNVESSAACVNVTPTVLLADTTPRASASRGTVATEAHKAVQTAAEIELGSFEVDLSPSDDIPKTGFDFLDNW